MNRVAPTIGKQFEMAEVCLIRLESFSQNTILLISRSVVPPGGGASGAGGIPGDTAREASPEESVSFSEVPLGLILSTKYLYD